MAIGSAVFSIFGPKIMGEATTELFAPTMAKMEAFSGLKEILPEDVVTQIENGEISQDQIINVIKDNVDMSDPQQVAVLQQAYTEYQAAGELKIDFSRVAEILIFVLILYAVSGLMSFIMNFIMAKTSQQIVYDMRRQVDAKLSRLPLKYFDGRTHGEILSRVTNDIDTVSTTLSQGLTQVITSVTMVLGIIVMMFTISWLMTLVCLLVLPMSFILVQIIVKKSQKYFRGQQKELGHLNGHVEEMYGGHLVVKAFGKEEGSVKDFDDINERLYTVGWKAQFLSGIMMPAVNFISNISYVLVCVVGGVMVINKGITVGDVSRRSYSIRAALRSPLRRWRR